ncbi:MAG: TIGR03545 family protein [Desulfobacterales bacterium]|nr:TIGR03545 family protein [Desulfobacterales bacterium]
MKWVRWKGLIAFVAVLIIVTGVWFFVVDSAIEAVIEKTGTSMVGAKVELGGVDLSISPLGLSLTGLQVTNPDEPMTNAVQVDRIALSLEGARLLLRKVIVKEMTLEGVRLNTPRNKSGAIRRPSAATPAPQKKTADKKFALPSLEAPDAKEILKKEKLQSLDQITALQADLKTEKDQWRKRLADLPDKDKLAAYNKRIKKLKSAKKGGLKGILSGAKEISAIRKELRKDLDRIETARKELKKDLSSFRRRIDEVTKVPQSDIQRLKEKYALSPQGLTNVSRLVLGEKISTWADTALGWYERLRPVLERAKEQEKAHEVVKPVRGNGVNVRFKEHEPLPDFLIRITRVSMEMPAGSMKGRITNITPDQDILGVPLAYDFSGKNLKRLRSVKLDGVLDHVDQSGPKDTAHFEVKGYQIADFNMCDSPELPMVLKKATADFKADAALAGEALKANLWAGLRSVKISTGIKKDAGPLAKAMASSISDMNALNIKAAISGTLADYDIDLSSDLDRVLKDAVGKQAKAQAARFEKELKAAISEKVSGPLAELKASHGGLHAVGSELAGRLDLGSELLKGMEKKGPAGLKLPGILPKFQ